MEDVLRLAVCNREWKRWRKRPIEMLIIIIKSCVIPTREIAIYCSPTALRFQQFKYLSRILLLHVNVVDTEIFGVLILTPIKFFMVFFFFFS